MKTPVPHELTALAHCARELVSAVERYRAALLAARCAGASWAQLATVLGLTQDGARGRHRVARSGGEIHLVVLPPEESMP
jgi:hypothetical protein